MQISYDSKYDLLYIRFGKSETHVDTKVIDEDINLDFDADGRLHGIEVLDASKRLDLSAILPLRIAAWQPAVAPDNGIQGASLQRGSRAPRGVTSRASTPKSGAASQ